MTLPKLRVLFAIGSLLAMVVVTYSIFNLFVFCTSNFLTTLVIYIVLSAVPVFLLRTNSALHNFSLVMLSLLLVFFCAEVFLRFGWKDPITYSEMHGNGYVSMYRTDVGDNWHVLRKEGRKDIHTLEWAPFEVRDNTTLDYSYPDYQCNAKGLRGTMPVANQKVVLTVGDSFNEGAGAPCDSTYPALLESHLREKDPSWAVINGGVSGNDPFFDWQMLRKLNSEFAIAHVVFLINSTDVNDIQMRGGMERFLPSGKLNYTDGPWWEPIYAFSFVSRLFVHGVLKVERNLMTSEENMRTIDLAIERLGHLFETEVIPYCQNNGIKVHIIAHPLSHELIGSSDVYEQLTTVLKGLPEVSFSDCRPFIQQKPDIDQLYWPNDRHFKPSGYALLSQCVLGGFAIVSPPESILQKPN